MNDDATSVRSIDGLIAVVTGVVQGLGLGIVRQLARDGATAIIAGLQREKTETRADQLRGDGLKVQAAHLNITNSTGVTAFLMTWSASTDSWISSSTTLVPDKISPPLSS